MEDIGDEQIVVTDLERAEPIEEWLADELLVVELNDERNSDDDNDHNDVQVLDVSFESCQLLNHAYQESLDTMADSLRAELRQNEAKQKELTDESEHVRRAASASHSTLTNSLLPFMAPYFKDEKGLTPPDNEDTIVKRAKEERNQAYVCTNRPWSASERRRLTELVRKEAMETMQQPLRKEKESLAANESEMSAEISGRIDELTRQLEAIEGKELSEIEVAERNDSTVDWLKIDTSLNTQHNHFDCEIYWNNYLHPHINNAVWSTDEDQRLEELVVKYKKKEWDRVAEELGTGRVGWQCCARYQSELNSEMRRVGPLTKDEAEIVDKVINNCRVGDYIPWHQVSYFVKGRTLTQIKHYWNKVNVPKRGKVWTDEENRVLTAAVKKFGIKNWQRVAYYLPGRSNRQCRERYMMRLNVADRRLGNWTEQEDELIMKWAPIEHFRWIELEKHIKGRNARQIASRYDMLYKWKQSERQGEGVAKRDGKPKTRTLTIKSKLNDKIRSLVNRNQSQPENVDDILRTGRARLARQLELEKSGMSVQSKGRPKKKMTEVDIDTKITEFFAKFYDQRSAPKKGIVLSTQDQIVYQTAKSAVNDLITGEQNTIDSKLSDAIQSTIAKTVTKASDESLGSYSYLPPIFPPNRATVKGLRSLLTQTDHLTETVAKGKIDLENTYANFRNSPEFSELRSRFMSVFGWPCLLSKTNPKESEIQLKVERTATSASKLKAGRRSWLSTDSTRLIEIREKQSQLIKTALQSKDEDNEGDNNGDNDAIDETSAKTPWYLKPRDRKYSLKSLDKQSFIYTRVYPKRQDMPALEQSESRGRGRRNRQIVTGDESQTRETAGASTVQKQGNKNKVKSKELTSDKDNASHETREQLVATTSAQINKKPRGRPPKRGKKCKK